MSFCESFTRRKKRAGISDAGASSDIAFLLIIYFIVIAGFNINKGFLLNLPAKDSTRHIKSEDLLRFELNDEGGIVYREATIESEAAQNIIQQELDRNPQIAVVLTISRFTPWQDVVSFVEMAQKLNIEAFSFSMKEGGAL